MSSISRTTSSLTNVNGSSQAGLFAPTADGSDTWVIDVCGGGRNQGNPATRGANLRLNGNEANGTGTAFLSAGNVSGALVVINGRAAAGGLTGILSCTGDYVDIAVAGTVPSTNPSTNVARLYNDAGTLKYRTSGGTVRTISFT